MPRLRRPLPWPAPLLALASLAACQPGLTVDLTDGPVDTADEVVLAFTGVTLLNEDNGTVSVPFGDTQLVNLLDFQNGATHRFVANERTDSGRYVGIALNFAGSGSVARRDDGTEFTITTPATSEFAAIDVTLERRKERRVVVDLNLRFSLIDDSATSGTYVLEPVVRAVVPDDTGTISGIVSSTLVESDGCRQGRELTTGVAVYAFTGSDVTPADYAGQADLIDADSVEFDSAAEEYRYALHFLPPGDYTVALTCEADSDDPRTADGIAFESSQNATVGTGATTTVNFQ